MVVQDLDPKVKKMVVQDLDPKAKKYKGNLKKENENLSRFQRLNFVKWLVRKLQPELVQGQL